jgi:GNAT superfamily N-acetyltransferase
MQNKLGIQANVICGAFCGAMSGVDTLAFNRVFGIGIDFEIDRNLIDAVINFYREANIPRYFIPLSPVAEPEYASQLLLDAGFTHYNNWAKFYKKLDTALPEISTSFTIDEVKLSESEQFDQIIKEAFQWDDDGASLFSQTIGRPGWSHYFARYEGIPVAATSMFCCGKYASLAIAGTLPEYRGKGAQSALVTRRYNDAISRGCKYMVVETAEDKVDKPSASHRNIKKFGELYLL